MAEKCDHAGLELGIVLRATIQQVFTLPPKKNTHTHKSEVPAHSSVPGLGAEESGELKEFVDNYLTLADKALGFTRYPGPNPHLTISVCLHCQHTIAATSLKLLAFAENLHACPSKQREPSPELKNAA